MSLLDYKMFLGTAWGLIPPMAIAAREPIPGMLPATRDAAHHEIEAGPTALIRRISPRTQGMTEASVAEDSIQQSLAVDSRIFTPLVHPGQSGPFHAT